MHNHSTRWTKHFLTKVVVLAVILLISVQYLVNVAVIRRNESVIFLKFLDTSLGKVLNQSGIYVQESMRQAVTTTKKPKELCPVIPPKLKGHVQVSMQVAAWAYIEQENNVLLPGGRYMPPECQARHRVAVIIPYRDREIHLKIFLRNIHPFLQRQQLDYGIFVVEMAQNVTFNRALLMNVGFVEALKQHDYQCFVFHDVDLLPEDDRNLYTCPQTPRHMSVAIDRLKYKLPYSQIFGGVSAINRDHFKKINGFSNIFFGWGGEDDDMYRRILYSNLTVIRYSPEVARYKMLVHVKENGNSDRFMLLRTVKARRLTDGLSSLRYQVQKLELKKLYTWVLISVNESEIVNAEPIHKLAMNNLKLRPGQKKPSSVLDVKPVKPDQAMKTKVKEIVKVNEEKTPKVDIEIINSNATVVKVNKTKVIIGKEVTLELKNKSATIQNRKGAAPKQTEKVKQKKVKIKAKNPTVISWIPTEFKGIIPTSLTKFEPLPVIIPAHIKNRKEWLRTKQKIIAKKQKELQQRIALKQRIMKQKLAQRKQQISNNDFADKVVLEEPQNVNDVVGVGKSANQNVQQQSDTVLKPESSKI